MRGTGTENDPYIVDNIADFRAACQMSKVYVELEHDLDCNDDETTADGWKSLSLNCNKIDGKGHTIRNIYIAAGYNQSAFVFMNSSMSGGIHNLNFENIFSFYTFISTSGAGSLYNCNFSGIINTNATAAFCNYNLKAEKCTFNFKVNSTNTSGIAFSYLNAESCEFKLDISSKKKYTGSNGLIARSAENSYVTGSLGFLNADNDVNHQSNLFAYSRHSYVAMSIKNAGNNIRFCSSSAILPCFYNADLIENSEFTVQDNVYALTTEQCKDKDYLNSIGFVVV